MPLRGVQYAGQSAWRNCYGQEVDDRVRRRTSKNRRGPKRNRHSATAGTTNATDTTNAIDATDAGALRSARRRRRAERLVSPGVQDFALGQRVIAFGFEIVRFDCLHVPTTAGGCND
jgi:hypothetical protein